MKKKFSWALCILCTIALIPFSVGIKWYEAKPINQSISGQKNESLPITTLNPEDINAVCCIAIEYLNENTNKETDLAILSLCVNNYLYEKSASKNNYEPNISSYSDTMLKKLKSIISEGLVELMFNGSMVYIPIVDVSAGYIATSDEYPYINEVASPWDTFSDKYPPKKSTQCGISIEGIKYLCENSTSAVDALKWYLPDFDITYIESKVKAALSVRPLMIYAYFTFFCISLLYVYSCCAHLKPTLHKQ